MACNYDGDALTSDGSHLPRLHESAVLRLRPLGRDVPRHAICLQDVEGCTNPLSINYDASATVDDGNCDLSYMCLNGTIYDEKELMGCVPVPWAT